MTTSDKQKLTDEERRRLAAEAVAREEARASALCGAKLPGARRCIVCGEEFAEGTHRARRVCADCTHAWRMAKKRADNRRRRKTGRKRAPTSYAERRKRLEAAGAELVTTWRGRSCMGGGYAAHGEPIRTAWDAAPILPAGTCKRPKKGKAKKEASK